MKNRDQLVLRIVLSLFLGFAWLMGWSLTIQGTGVAGRFLWTCAGACVGVFSGLSICAALEYGFHLSGRPTRMFLFPGGRGVSFDGSPKDGITVLAAVLGAIASAMLPKTPSDILFSLSMGTLCAVWLTSPRSPFDKGKK